MQAGGDIIANLTKGQPKQNLKTTTTAEVDAEKRLEHGFAGKDTAPNSLDKAASGFGQNPLPKFVQQGLKTIGSINNALTGVTNFFGITTPAPTPSSAPEQTVVDSQGRPL